MSTDGAQLGVGAGNARVIDDDMIILTATNIDDSLTQGKGLVAVDDEERPGREQFTVGVFGRGLSGKGCRGAGCCLLCQVDRADQQRFRWEGRICGKADHRGSEKSDIQFAGGAVKHLGNGIQQVGARLPVCQAQRVNGEEIIFRCDDLSGGILDETALHGFDEPLRQVVLFTVPWKGSQTVFDEALQAHFEQVKVKFHTV